MIRGGRAAPWGAALLLACTTGRRPARDVIFPSPYLEADLVPPAAHDSTRTYPLLVALHRVVRWMREGARR